MMYPLKTKKKPQVFWSFQGVQKHTSGIKWANAFNQYEKHWINSFMTDITII